jgi:hypothetical protein
MKDVKKILIGLKKLPIVQLSDNYVATIFVNFCDI